MTFEKHLHSVSRAASQRLGILRTSWWVFHDRLLLGRCVRGVVLPVLEYCSAIWCSAADTQIKLLDWALSSARFLTGGVFECDIYHRKYLALLCMLYKIRCNPVHPLDGALPGPYLPVPVTRGALVAHRYTYALPRSTAGLLFPSQCPTGMILLTQYSMVWAWRVSRAGPIHFYWPNWLYPYYSLYSFSLSLSVYGLVLWGWGLRPDRVYITLSQPLSNNDNNNNNHGRHCSWWILLQDNSIVYTLSGFNYKTNK